MRFSQAKIDIFSNDVDALRIIIQKTNLISPIKRKITIVIIIIGIGGGRLKDK